MSAQTNIPKLRFREFSGEWEEKKLRDVGTISMCKRIFKEETKQSGDVPFFKIGTFGKTPDAFIDQNLYNEYKQKYPFPKKGDILISASGTIGRLVVYDGLPAYFQDSNIVWIANDEKTVKNKFLFYCYLNTRWTTEDTTIARLYNDNLNRITIAAPKLPEQQKIASFLTDVDARIGLMQKRLALLKKYKKGVMQKIFSQEIKFKDENGKEYPEWEEGRFTEIIESISSKPYQIQSNEIRLKGLFPVIDQGQGETAGYSDSKDKLLVTTENLIIFGDHTVSTKFIDIRNIKYSKGIIIGADGVKVLKLRPHGVHVLEYIYQYMQYNPIKSEGYKRHYSILKKMIIPTPNKNEQQKIAEFLTGFDDKISLEERRLEQAKRFKKSLLQQMFI